jgi:putative FmdB family regulatory protein
MNCYCFFLANIKTTTADNDQEPEMPIYEYKCNDCEIFFEVLTFSASDADKIQCSECKSERVTKVISAGSFRLGSGTTLASSAPAGCGGKSGFS